MRHVRVLLLVATLGLTALAGCVPGDGERWTQVAADLSPEAAALSALGYEVDGQVGKSATGEAARPGPADRWHERRQRAATRVLLRRHALHGEAVVETANGTVTVLFQRGEVEAVTETGVAVRSRDGFSQTWTFGPELRVVEARGTVQPRPLSDGDPVGVAGIRRDGQPVARLIFIDGR
ncbi:MAG TPA: hypothetical protein VKY81_05520 [Natronosporangium sp.]|nr:hypothetical protein [Natronosporangium sp.]